MKRIFFLIVFWMVFTQWSCQKIYYVDINGSDSTGDGSSSNPWRTLNHALSEVPTREGNTIKLSSGIFVATDYLKIGDRTNIEGEGMGLTVIKPDSSLSFRSHEWHFDKFLITLSDSGGNQVLKNFSIDGNSKQLYGGILVHSRKNVLIESVRVENCYFTGIWIHDALDTRVTNVLLKDNAWGDATGSSGSLTLGKSKRLEIDHIQVDEHYGQAIDVVNGEMYNLKLHHNRFSVNPTGSWKTPTGDDAPNICVEFFDAELRDVEVYNNYFDNSLSVVISPAIAAQNNTDKTIRIYNNIFDLKSRANGYGYGLELTVDNAEVDHNYFRGGFTSIVNWEPKENPARKSWKIHHNVFFELESKYPSAVITFFQNGISDAHIYNNTVEMAGTSTVSFIEANHGGQVRNIKVENNLVIDSNVDYKWYPNKFISLNGAKIQSGIIRNNFLERMKLTTIAGLKYSNNYSGRAEIRKTGTRPDPYYTPMPESPLVNAGLPIESSHQGAAPDIGAYDTK